MVEILRFARNDKEGYGSVVDIFHFVRQNKLNFRKYVAKTEYVW